MTAFPATPLILNGLFLGCLATLVFGAVLAVTSARLIRSVCGLAVYCFGLSGLYYFLHSPFLALMEILIYVGAVCVTIVFAIMLAEPDEPARTETSGSTLVWEGWHSSPRAASLAAFSGSVTAATGVLPSARLVTAQSRRSDERC